MSSERGTSETGPAPRVEGLRNLRDIGGLPTVDGRRTRPGLLFRAEAPVDLPPGGVDALAALGLRTTIDLRDVAEDQFAATSLPEGVARLFAGVVPPAGNGGVGLLEQLLSGELRAYGAEDLAASYVQFVEAQAEPLGRAVRYCADPAHLPTLVHCVAGKDRTGLVVAMVLDVVGVRRDAIVADYELTSQNRAYRREEIQPALTASGVDWARVSPLFLAPAEALVLALAHVEREHGSVEGFLTGPAGVPPEVIALLADLLVEGEVDKHANSI